MSELRSAVMQTLGRRLLPVLAVTQLLSGCGEDATQVYDDGPVFEQLEGMGYARERVEIEGNFVRIDGDLVLYRDKLLNGEYEPDPAAFSEAEMQKSWKWFTVGSAYRSSIKLVWASGSEHPSTAIKNAFLAAAADYTAVPNSTISIKTTNAGESITVHMIDGFLWPKAGSGCSYSSIACTVAPVGSKPSAHIYIKSLLNNDPTMHPCDWTTSSLKEAALHELGHAIGLDHPYATGANDANHVNTTAWCTNPSSANCGRDPFYPTVMATNLRLAPYPTCTSPYTVLQADDSKAVSYLY